MSYACGSANCTHTAGMETHKEGTPTPWATEQQSSSHAPTHLLLCLHKHAFLSLLFLVLCSFESARNRRRRRRKVRSEEGTGQWGTGGGSRGYRKIKHILDHFSLTVRVLQCPAGKVTAQGQLWP